ncbi:MAG: ATP-binding protein [Pseudarthrobacter sp.]
MQPSPYTPGEVANTVPGRAPQIAEFDERLSLLVDLQRFIGRIRVDHAPRGLGKTSLLRQYQIRARERGVLAVWVTAGEDIGLIGQIASAIRQDTQSWRGETRTKLHKTLEALTVSVGVPGIAKMDATIRRPVETAPVGTREFEYVIRMAAGSDENTGLILLIDEIQAADPAGLRTLAYAWQHLQAEGADVPAAVFAAGLPDAPEKISSVVTFTERIAYRPLQILTPDAEEIAISVPARHIGVTWQPDALHEALEIARGYPYSVQLIADASWSAAGRPDPGATITLDHVRHGGEAMKVDLEALFRARWANAAPQERELMSAMAALGDTPVKRSDVAQQMNVTTASLSMPRARLIDKGFIQAAERGELEFTIPGFAAFIRTLDQ